MEMKCFEGMAQDSELPLTRQPRIARKIVWVMGQYFHRFHSPRVGFRYFCPLYVPSWPSAHVHYADAYKFARYKLIIMLSLSFITEFSLRPTPFRLHCYIIIIERLFQPLVLDRKKERRKKRILIIIFRMVNNLNIEESSGS
jgi:hypothetical protein